MNYEITEEQIKELAKGNAKVKKMFPEVFKTKTGWFKTKTEGNESYLMYFENGINKYGFNGAGRWREKSQGATITTDEYLATDSEVLEALTNEAKKIGFKEGVYCNNSKLYGRSHLNYKLEEGQFKIINNELHWYIGGEDDVSYCIMKRGVWATPVKTYTKEEAEKLLNAKII